MSTRVGTTGKVGRFVVTGNACFWPKAATQVLNC